MSPLEHAGRELHSLLRRRLHHLDIAVAGKAIRTRHQLHWRRALMFLMTSRTGPILDHIWFVEGMLLMAALAFPVDGFECYSVAEPLS